ncbi:MAG: hypothetical protein IT323_15105 [Anaerolineae bacterium]|nr:hypothetical protein [Anaerolineae bacterium]
MGKLTQAGVITAILGAVVAFIGLFPGVVGLEVLPGIGLLQIIIVLIGFSLLFFGAYVFAQNVYYPGVRHNLAQQIGARLSMTGLVIAVASGLADILGFGSHPPIPPVQRPFLGSWQTAGLIGGFVVASFGLILFVLLGPDDGGEGGSDDGDSE